MNKTAKSKILGLGLYVIVFSIMVVFWVFIYNFLYQVGDENVNAPLNVVVLDVANQTNVSVPMTAHLASLPDSYRNTDLSSDLYFIVFFGAFVITGLIMAVKSQKESILSLFGTLSAGMMMFFLLINYVEPIRQWLIDNLISGILGIDITNTVIISAYINNAILIDFVILLIFIAANQLDFSWVKKTGGRIEA